MIRPASASEAATLTELALEAKRYWGYPEHWIKQWESDLTISTDFINSNQVYVAEEADEIQGFYALCVNGGRAELEHMWVRPQFIGTGIGKELFLDAMDKATALNVREVEIVADPNAAGFYEKMGAERVGEADSSVDGQLRKLPRLKIDVSD